MSQTQPGERTGMYGEEVWAQGLQSALRWDEGTLEDLGVSCMTTLPCGETATATAIQTWVGTDRRANKKTQP
eukprot:6188803-Pleurochrysis_carterae.AAC.4